MKRNRRVRRERKGELELDWQGWLLLPPIWLLPISDYPYFCLVNREECIIW